MRGEPTDPFAIARPDGHNTSANVLVVVEESFGCPEGNCGTNSIPLFEKCGKRLKIWMFSQVPLEFRQPTPAYLPYQASRNFK
jgi:hypothetical protein